MLLGYPMTKPEKYFTMSDIARLIGVPRHRVEWVLKTRRITAAVEIGENRGFSSIEVEQIRTEIKRIDSVR